jgi:hypothetical protein
MRSVQGGPEPYTCTMHDCASERTLPWPKLYIYTMCDHASNCPLPRVEQYICTLCMIMLYYLYIHKPCVTML